MQSLPHDHAEHMAEHIKNIKGFMEKCQVTYKGRPIRTLKSRKAWIDVLLVLKDQ